MNLYKAEKGYIDFLRNKDTKVMDNKDPAIRPYWFCEVEIDGQKFAVPLSSPKEAGANRFNPFTMIQVKIKSDELGRLYFINMIPFNQKLFVPVNKINAQYDLKYANLLYKQASELTKQKDKINSKAKNVFNARYDQSHRKYAMLVTNSCDFKKCVEYMKDYLVGLEDPKKSFKQKLSKAKIVSESNEAQRKDIKLKGIQER